MGKIKHCKTPKCMFSNIVTLTFSEYIKGKLTASTLVYHISMC